MPTLTGVMRAYHDIARRDQMAVVEAYDAGRTDRRRLSAEFADLATAESRFDSLALELRRPDGSIVRTKWIGVQDTAMMMAFVDEQRARGVFDQDEPEYDAELEASVAHDMEIIDEWFGDETQRRAELDEVDTPDSDDDGDELPSFQLLVELGKGEPL